MPQRSRSQTLTIYNIYIQVLFAYINTFTKLVQDTRVSVINFFSIAKPKMLERLSFIWRLYCSGSMRVPCSPAVIMSLRSYNRLNVYYLRVRVINDTSGIILCFKKYPIRICFVTTIKLFRQEISGLPLQGSYCDRHTFMDYYLMHSKYSRTSMARTLMASLPRLFRTHS